MTDPTFTTEGQAERMARAADALVDVLVTTDPRVWAAFEAWCVRHALTAGLSPEAFRAALLRDRAADLAALDRLVADGLRLPYRWLPQMLLIKFATIAIADQAGAAVGVTLEPTRGILPPGRRPKRPGTKAAWRTDYIRRDVEWFYRLTVKHPRDTSYRIGREYAAAIGRRPGGDGRVDAHGVIETAIRRVTHLLGALTLDTPAI